MNYPGTHPTATEPPEYDPEDYVSDDERREDADFAYYLEQERFGLYDEPGAQTPTEPPPFAPYTDDEWLEALGRPHPYSTSPRDVGYLRESTRASVEVTP